MRQALPVMTALTLSPLWAIHTEAAVHTGQPEIAMQLFADNCFSPLMTTAKAFELFDSEGLRYDFYDLDPFANGAHSPVTGRAATSGIDRRCEVSFDGDHAEPAAQIAVEGLQSEGILTDAPLPASHVAIPGTALLAARALNPKRIAVVHVGTRPGPNGVETFLSVERLTPAASAEALQ